MFVSICALAYLQAGLAPVNLILSMYSACSDESSLAVWAQIVTNISDLSLIMQSHPMFSTYQAFLRSLYTKIVNTGTLQRSHQHYCHGPDCYVTYYSCDCTVCMIFN